MSKVTSEVVEMAGVAEVMREANLGGGLGVWRSCSGCHETNEGAETGHYPYSAALGCYLGGGCHECGGLGATWEYWSEAQLAALQADMKPAITLWLPEQDRHRLAVLGKLAEECNELSARAVRCIIHGIDEIDPKSGLSNREELERETADVLACIDQAGKRVGLKALRDRVKEKFDGFDKWHDLIDGASK